MSTQALLRRTSGYCLRLIGPLLSVLMLVSVVVVTHITPASAATDNNPVLSGYNADPQIAVFNHTFYIYPTTDGIANWDATSFQVWSSTDMIHWTNHGVILNLANVSWCHSNAWSPSIVQKGATYYFYFTACSQIGVATSSSPTGPFTDALGKPLVATSQYGVDSIDPAVFLNDTGQPYLIFGNGGARLATLNANMVSFNGTPATITPSGASYREAPYMFKRNGIYYLTWSQNDTRQATYQVSYAMSSSITGPFVASSGNPILSENTNLGILGTGSASIWGASTGQYYIVYHSFNAANGDGTNRQVDIDPLNFNSDGTIQHVAVSLTGLQAAVSPSPNNPSAFGYLKLVNRNSGKVLDVTAASTASGANVEQWTDNGGTNQQWTLAQTGASYTIVNHNSGKVLDVAGASTANGANVDQATSSGGTNQQWKLVPTGNYYTVVNVNSGKVLDVTNRSTANGANVEQWTSNGGTNQQWTLVPMD